MRTSKKRKGRSAKCGFFFLQFFTPAAGEQKQSRVPLPPLLPKSRAQQQRWQRQFQPARRAQPARFPTECTQHHSRSPRRAHRRPPRRSRALRPRRRNSSSRSSSRSHQCPHQLRRPSASPSWASSQRLTCACLPQESVSRQESEELASRAVLTKKRENQTRLLTFQPRCRLLLTCRTCWRC